MQGTLVTTFSSRPVTGTEVAKIVLRGDPSLVVRARIKLLASPCLHHICCFCYGTTFIYALHLLMCSIFSCTTLTYALHSFLSFHISAVYVLHLFIHHSYSRLALIHLSYSFMRHICSCVTLIYVSHSPICCTYLCIALIHLLHSFHASYSFNDALHLFMRCIHSCIALSMRYVTSLFSRISYAACSLLTSFFSLTYIKFQIS